ncbi:MAG: ABC transporter permease [Muribaculaceae bacterium]|nr:ABC transporter permease [Muribaculaceae bacterium]
MTETAIWVARNLGFNKKATPRTGNVIAVLGVAFAVAVLELTLAISVGFKNEITANLKGFVADITVLPSAVSTNTEVSTIELNGELYQDIAQVDKDATVTPVVMLNGIIKTENDFAAISIKGFEDDYKAEFEKKKIRQGKWPDGERPREIAISQTLADKLGIDADDKINICFVSNGRLRARPFTVVGIYDTGFSDYDDIIAFSRSADLRKIAGIKDGEATGVEIRNIDLKEVEEKANQLENKFIYNYNVTRNPATAYQVDTIVRQGAVFLNWLELLNTNVVVIFILMILIAASTLISSLFIQVLDKVNAIGLLRAIGAPNKFISDIFIYLSLKLTLWGVLIGNIIGLSALLLQKYTGAISLDPSMYYIDTVPINISVPSIVLLNVGILAFSWLILLLPGRIATRMSPAATLRFD